jgi:phosphoribosylamine--glycine ligase
MHILILGSGGREHALAWAISQNPKCDTLSLAPGNGGTHSLGTSVEMDICNGAEVSDFCRENAVDFVVIGPEAPLVAGVADQLRASGILTFGPSAAAAHLEASKSFTKEVCDASNAPTAAYARFTDRAAALGYLSQNAAPIVIKADGLAAGKGVVVALNDAQARDATDDMFSGKHGAAGEAVVIEEFMDGEEASFFVLCDGKTALPIGTAQDHKRAFDGDAGPNTGGMGAYSPAPVLTDTIAERAMAEIIQPTIDEMARRGTPYEGVLYAGFMIKDGQARLVEYNVRFGDPECQVLMMRLGAQVLDLLLATAEKRLNDIAVNWAEDYALTVVLAADGYPGPYVKGDQIKGLEDISTDSSQMIFHAGTKLAGELIEASGGRVLNVTARAETLGQAREIAYGNIDKIDWPVGFYRKDIGWRGLQEQ